MLCAAAQLASAGRVASVPGKDLGDLSTLLRAAKAGKVKIDVSTPLLEEPQLPEAPAAAEPPAADSSATAAPRAVGTLTCSSKLGYSESP